MSALWNRRKAVIPALLVAMLPLATNGCYGSFPLTNKIYQFNGDISRDKLVKTITFWVLIIIPVYKIGMIADVIIFNVVEFWTGDKILAVGPTMDSSGNTFVLTPSSDGREAVLTVSRDGEVLAQERFIRVSDTVLEVRDAEGNLRGKALRQPDGTINLTDRDGGVVRSLPAGDLVAL